MIYLAIGDLRTNPDYAWLHLQGQPLMSGLLGCSYEPQASSEAVVEEALTLSLNGSQAEMGAVLRKLEEFVYLANRFTGEGVGNPRYLRLKYAGESLNSYARILHARLEMTANSLAYHDQGSLGVRLVFSRPNYFDSDEIPLPLSNGNGANLTSGLTLLNHDDSGSGHDNFFYVSALNLENQLPAPLRIELTNTTAAGALGDCLVGSQQFDATSGSPQLTDEAESGTGGSTVSDGSCSGGSFQRLVWSNSSWISLLSWSLPASTVSACQGRAYRPILRLANVHAYSDLQLRLVVSVGGVSLCEGAPTQAEPSQGYCILPPLRLPSAVLARVLYARPHTLSLQAYKPNGSSYTLDLDYLLLLPLDSCSHYQAILPLAQNDKLVDDAFSGLTYAVQSNQELATHVPLQASHHLAQGYGAYFYIFQADSSQLAPIERSLSVKAWYRQRKRIL